MVLKLSEHQYSAWWESCLFIQVRTPVIRVGRQAGMGIAYRMFVVGGRHLWGLNWWCNISHILQQRKKAKSPTFNSRNVKLPSHSVSSEKSLWLISTPTRFFIFIFLMQACLEPRNSFWFGALLIFLINDSDSLHVLRSSWLSKVIEICKAKTVYELIQQISQRLFIPLSSLLIVWFCFHCFWHV